MTVGQTHTENKIYSDIRNYASESTPLHKLKSQMEKEYGKERFWNVVEELTEKGEVSIKTLTAYGKADVTVICLLQSHPNNSAYSLSILSGQEVQRVTVSKSTALTDIPNLICAYFEVNESDINVKCKKREIVTIRQWCQYFQKEFTDCSLKTIGGYWGRDHSTVINSFNVINNLIDTDKQFKIDYDQIKRLIISKI